MEDGQAQEKYWGDEEVGEGIHEDSMKLKGEKERVTENFRKMEVEGNKQKMSAECWKERKRKGREREKERQTQRETETQRKRERDERENAALSSDSVCMREKRDEIKKGRDEEHGEKLKWKLLVLIESLKTGLRPNFSVKKRKGKQGEKVKEKLSHQCGII